MNRLFGILIVSLSFLNVPAWAQSALGLTGASAGQFRVIEKWPSGNAKSIKVSGILPSLSAGGTATVTLTGPAGLSVPLTVQEALYPGGPTAGVARTNEPFVVGVPIADSMGITSVSGNFGGLNLATDNGSTITVATGTATFTIKKASFNVLDSVVVGSTTLVSSSTSGTRGLVLTGPSPTAPYPGNVTCTPQSGGSTCSTIYSSAYDPNSTCSIDNSDNGPAMAVIKCVGTLFDSTSTYPYMQYSVWETFFQNRNTANLRVILRNANYNTSSVPSPDFGGAFDTAYKGLRAFELRLGTSISTVNFTVGTASGSQTGSLSSGDSAFVYEGQSNGVVGTGDCTFGSACANLLTTDHGWTVKKNSTVLASDTSGSTCPAGWADINDGSGKGVEIGMYQFCPEYPASLEFEGTGAEARIGFYSAQNSGNVYAPWPYWNVKDMVLSFHTSTPASLNNAFQAYQAPLVARADRTYYNSTNFFFNQMPSAAEETSFYTSVGSAANPAFYYSICANPGTGPCIQDWPNGSGGNSVSLYTQWVNWDAGGGGPYIQQDQRFNNLQIWIKYGFTGRYLDSANFFRFTLSRAWEHSDGTSPTDHTVNGWQWSSRPQWGQPNQELNQSSQETATSANSSSATISGGGGALKFDYNHQHYHGIFDFYGLTGDESIKDGLISMKEYYLDRHSYAWNSGNEGTVRALGLIMLDAAKFSEFLASIGDSDAANVLAMGTNTYVNKIQPDICVTDGVNNYPTGCSLPSISSAPTGPPWDTSGVSRVWGMPYGELGRGGSSWCNVGTSWRISQQFMQSIMIDGLIELQRAQGSGWTYYKQAGDLAFGVAQFGMDQEFTSNGSSKWLDLPNDNPSCHGTACHALNNGVSYFEWLDNAQTCPSGTSTSSGGPYLLSDGNVYDSNSIVYAMQTQFNIWRWAADVLGTLPANELLKMELALQKNADNAPLVNNYDVGAYTTGEVIKSLAEPSGLALQSVTPSISETPPGSGTYNVSWTTPASATGIVRVKYSTTRQIVDWLGYNKFARTWQYSPATYTPWFAATPTQDIAAVPGPQTLQVATGQTGLSAGNFSVKVLATPPPSTPTNLVLVSGNNQTGTAGQPLASPFTVEVTGAGGNPVSGVTVTFTVTAGGGTLSAASVATNSSGLASTTLTLGSTAGANTVVAASGTLAGSPITFNATGSAAATPANLVLVSGNNQTGTAGQPLSSPFTVEVTNASGNPVSGVTVTFTVTAGGGTLSAGSVATNSSGLASTTLTLGSTAGANTVVAASGTLTGSPMTFSATGTAPAQTAANLVLVSGNNQTGTAGQPLASPFTVEVTSAGGNPVSGVTITFTVTAGGGTLSAASVATNSSGLASSTLTLGSTAGANTVIAASGTLAGSPITFNATGSAPGQTPANLVLVSGNNQTGTAGQPLSSPFTVEVTNASGNPVSEVTVTFTVTAGGGTLSAGSVATNSSGLASTTLTLGSTAGANTVVAASGALPGSIVWSHPTTTGSPGNNGYLQDVEDTYNNLTLHYGVVDGSTSIYSTYLFHFNPSTLAYTPLGGYGSTTGTCTASTLTNISDSHPYGMMVMDANRNRIWTMVGAQEPCYPPGEPVNTSGSGSGPWQVTDQGPAPFDASWAGLTVSINSVVYTVASSPAPTATTLYVTTNPGTQTGVAMQPLVVLYHTYYADLTALVTGGPPSWHAVTTATHTPNNSEAMNAYDPEDDIIVSVVGSGAGGHLSLFCPTDRNGGNFTAAQTSAGCVNKDDWTIDVLAWNQGTSGYPQGENNMNIFYNAGVHKFIMWGGQPIANNTDYTETWTYAPLTKTFAQVATSGSVPPNGCTSIGGGSCMLFMAYDPLGNGYVYHQTGGAGAPQDWYLSYSSGTWAWNLLTSGGTGPSAVPGTMAYNAPSGLLSTFSSPTGGGGTGDTWIGTLGRPGALAGSPMTFNATGAAGGSFSPCDLNMDGVVNNADVQIAIAQVLSPASCGSADLVGNGQCTVVDVQRVINAALGGACLTGQ